MVLPFPMMTKWQETSRWFVWQVIGFSLKVSFADKASIRCDFSPVH